MLIRINHLNLFVKLEDNLVKQRQVIKRLLKQRNRQELVVREQTRTGVCMEEDIEGARCKKKGLPRTEM